ncbi:TetR family transcriptional regulator [Mycolicibacterium mageritense DSM 44476 = CIP 104973]
MMATPPTKPTTPGNAPLVMKLLWGHQPAPAQRGPQRALTIDQIVAAAIALADDQGYAAISMAAVAKRLGFTTMSLYRYVDAKDTLLALLADRAMGPAPAIDRTGGWRQGLRNWALAEFDAISAHPWWLEIPPHARPAGPNTMSWLDAGLSTMADLDIPEPLKLQLVSNLSLYIMSRSRLVHQMAAEPDSPADYQDTLASTLDPKHYPHLTKALTAQSFQTIADHHWEETDFVFGLDRLLDGYTHYIDQ